MQIVKNIFIIVLCALFILIGCSKQDLLNQDNLSSDVQLSSVSVFNAIPNSTGVLLFIDQGSALVPTVSASDRLAYGRYLPYKNWFSSNFLMSIENQSLLSKETVQRSISLSSGKIYSLFLYKKRNLQTFLSEDNILKPSEGKLKIRVAHFSENLAAVNVVNNKTNTKLFEDIKFETVSRFIEIDAGLLPSEISIKTLDSRIDIPMVGNTKLENRGIYTILIKGIVNVDNKDNVDFSIIKQ